MWECVGWKGHLHFVRGRQLLGFPAGGQWWDGLEAPFGERYPFKDLIPVIDNAPLPATVTFLPLPPDIVGSGGGAFDKIRSIRGYSVYFLTIDQGSTR